MVPRAVVRVAQFLLLALPASAGAQIIREARSAAAADSALALEPAYARQLQADFETFRKLSLPFGGIIDRKNCDERVGRLCYRYDADQQLPAEPAAIATRRERLIFVLDSSARVAPIDRWSTGQRVRYLAEAGRLGAALQAARECRVGGWWCLVLEGFALHELGEYIAADSVYAVALARMQPEDRCAWRSVDMLLDAEAQLQYRRHRCDDPERAALEDRAWFFARTMYSRKGNDSRTEYYARQTMVKLLRDAPGPFDYGFDPDERELLLRFGWPRAWSLQVSLAGPTYNAPPPGEGTPGGIGGPRGPGDPKGPSTPGGNTLPPGMGRPGEGGKGPVTGPGIGIRGGTGGRGGGVLSPYGLGWQSSTQSILGFHLAPAYRYIPPGFVLIDPSISDSTAWRPQLPPVIARYAPPYARQLVALEHQKALFRRGDSAIVVLAYDARALLEIRGKGTLGTQGTPSALGGVSAMGLGITAALVVTPANASRDFVAAAPSARSVGVFSVHAPWGPLLMSAEVAVPAQNTLGRARYGLAPPITLGSRVTVSDLLFYKPYGSFPASVEDAAPHALPTERVNASDKLGVYWEAYGTDPAGENMRVSLIVVRETGKEKTPVSVTVQDQSARGARVTPRALEVDISTLRRGSYTVQLEILVAGQFVARADHRIEVVAP